MHNLRNISLNAVLLMGCLLSFAAKAQEQAPSVMTLHDCMEYAVSNSTRMRIQAADRSDEQIARRDAILQAFLPSISAGVSGSSNFGRAIDPETNVYINKTSLSNGYSLSGSMTLFNGFSAVNNIRISATLSKMGLSQERIAQDQLCLAVMEAFYNVLYFSKMCDYMETQAQAVVRELRKAEIQEQTGQKGYADLVQMRANQASREQSLVNARNQRESAMLTLKDLMFWPVSNPLSIDTSSVEKSGASIYPHMDGVEAITEYALVNNPQMLLADGKLRNARLSLNNARWRYAPSVSLSGGWSTGVYAYPGNGGATTLPFAKQFTNNMGSYLGLSIHVPIFNGLSLASGVQRSRNALNRAQAEYDQKKRDIENEVARAVNERDAAEASYVAADRNVEFQKEAFDLNSRKFEQGMLSGIDYQTSSAQYLEAESSRLNALFQYYIKSAVVRNYNGEAYLNQ